jgi:hypothetical protein
MGLKDLNIGDTVFVIGEDRRMPDFQATITEIGRRWAVIGHHGRFDRETGVVDHFGPTVRAWCSRADYEAHALLSAAWKDVRNDLQWAKMPAGMTIETINQARRLLGLKVFGE